MKGKVKLKICGMRDARNITDVAALKPEYMGFIFFSGSPRFVGEDFVIHENFPAEVIRTGVFVNEKTAIIKKKGAEAKLTFIQLHGDEPVKECVELKEAGYKVMKVFPVDDDFDFKVTKSYEGVADYFLFDTKGKYYGGNAKVFNWEVLQRYDQRVPFFLSGGLSPENIDQVEKLKGMNLHAVDINSGAEISPGLKSIDKIKDIIRILNSVF